MVDKLIQCIDDEIEPTPMNVKIAIDLMVSCWKKVSGSCIRNCYWKSGLSDEILEQEDTVLIPNKAIAILKECGIIADDFFSEDYVNCDMNLATSSPVDEEDIDIVRETIVQIMPVPSSPIQSEDGVESIKIQFHGTRLTSL